MAAELLSRSLAEEQPLVHITGPLLLEWYARYHPDAGTLRADTARELECCLGPELRELECCRYHRDARKAGRQAVSLLYPSLLYSTLVCSMLLYSMLV